MQCPDCGSFKSAVLDSRYKAQTGQKRRRRRCKDCGETFMTLEVLSNSPPPRVIKRDGRRESFDRDKLRQGVLLAVAKRPVSTEDVDGLIDKVVERLAKSGRKEIEARRVGEAVVGELLLLDRVAYIRFASVYRNFKDAGAFKDEADRLEKAAHPDVLSAQTEIVFKDNAARAAGRGAAVVEDAGPGGNDQNDGE